MPRASNTVRRTSRAAPPHADAPARRAVWLALPAAIVGLAASGCVTRLDMATAYEPGRPATTIPYSGVRGSRQFPDYEAVGRSILTGADAFAPAKGAPKAGKPKGGAK